MARPTGKPPYTKKFLREQKKRLVEERDGILEEIEADEEDILSWRDNANSGVDQHPADEATALTEQELGVTLIGNARNILWQIEQALRRIEDGTYGWDEEGECWIREERLKALPWALYEIETQTRLEREWRIGREGYSHDVDLTSI